MRDLWRCGCIIACAAAVPSCKSAERAAVGSAATPHARDVVITTVPLLTKELAQTYPFLKTDFAKGGVLDGKEVYEFMPSTITVGEGDTLRFTFINPEDDQHSFVMRDLSVSLPVSR